MQEIHVMWEEGMYAAPRLCWAIPEGSYLPNLIPESPNFKFGPPMFQFESDCVVCHMIAPRPSLEMWCIMIGATLMFEMVELVQLQSTFCCFRR